MKSSKHIHSTWYRETYPEVADLDIDPALHYLQYGAELGRNPGKNFDTRFYLRTYPDAAQSGLNPLLHYVLHGKAKGYATRPPKSPGAKHVAAVRTKLLSLGFTERPLQDLAEIQANAKVPETRALAARELALWHMRLKTPEGYRSTLVHLAAARADAPNLDFRRKLAVVELLCHYFMGAEAEGRASYERAALAGEVSPDLLLSLANFEPAIEARVALMNRVLRHYDISPITLLPDNTLSPYDRLTSAEPLAVVTDGPKVTVLIAAYDAADMLPTALRCLQEQTWKNLEILVLDDCSPTPDTADVAQRFADNDPRIRVIRMERNGGAYVARNRGLDEATGEYVTLHDADDWSHPRKIETQVRFMEENPEVMGCTTQQARATVNFDFTRFPHNGEVIRVNVSSFLWRQRVIDDLGGWATTRFGADSELIYRMKKFYGKESVAALKNGPFSFQRVSESSIVKDDRFGIDGYYYGVRHEFFFAGSQFSSNSENLNFPRVRNNIPYPIPNAMKPDRVNPNEVLEFDVIIASDFRMPGGSVMSCVEEAKAHAKAGLRTAIVTMYRYDLNYTDLRKMTPEVWGELRKLNVPVISYGETASCKLLILRYPPILEEVQRYMPKIIANEIRVIVNQPPMSDYGPDGVVRYHLDKCAENVRRYFGKDAVWHPIGPLVRDALRQHHASELHHIQLSDEDWSNIIDISGWNRCPRELAPQAKLRIGRHSRDSAHKWPDSRDDILSVYPEADDIEVHVLGGVKHPEALLGGIPKNWIVHEFGSIHPRDFLKDIDIWIYFSHHDWVESFGRTIIEAMAAGVPVILPEVYRPLFQDAAIYATPQTAIEFARELHADPITYRAQVERALSYVQNKFSYEMHINRINAAKNMPLAVPINANESKVLEPPLHVTPTKFVLPKS